MKNKFSCAVLVMLTVCFGLTLPCRAQSKPKEEELSLELAEFVRSKRESIKTDAVYDTEEWSGEYISFEGPTISTYFNWTAKSGFTVWWENCSRPWAARANYGSAELQNGSLRLVPQLNESVSGSFKAPAEFTPVRWGAQHFLIPSDQLMKFVYAVNSGSISEIEMFLMKVGDSEKKRDGLPQVPPAYARYLRMKPIVGVISGLGPEAEKRYRTVTLNVGKNKGVIPEMKFYLSSRNGFIILETTKVEDRTAEAWVVFTNFRNGKEFAPRVGRRVTSRAPKDSWRYMP